MRRQFGLTWLVGTVEFCRIATDGERLGTFSLGELDISSQRVSLEGLDEELERFKDHEMVMSILNQEGGDMKEYAKEVDRQLRQVELESIQDYIAESANLVEL